MNKTLVVINKIRQHGLKKTLIKLKKLLNKRIKTFNYNKWFISKHLPLKNELQKQKSYNFKFSPLISIITPTFNTPKQFLIEMLESVISQTYANWELCIADGASSNPETIGILQKYLNKDKRIKVKFLDQNYHISGNSNKALSIAAGEYICLLDHDDLLTPNCLFEVIKVINEHNSPDFIYSDEDKVDENSKVFFCPHFKPDFSPDTLRSYNYICHLAVIKKKLVDKVGGFRSECSGSQDYDLFLRVIDLSDNVRHIPKVLYHWRTHGQSTASADGFDDKQYVFNAAKIALSQHIKRIGLKGEVKDGLFSTSYKINYGILGNPLISIIIPNKDHSDTLKTCVHSILNKSTYKNIELIIVENNSITSEIFTYYKELEKFSQIKIIKYAGSFNFSAVNNFGKKYARGEYILLLNNDIEVITPNWMEEMLMFAQRDNVGIVGAKLFYPDDTIQHSGVIVGIGKVADHMFKNFSQYDLGYMGRTSVVQNLSAVTAACILIKSTVYDEVDGLDEKLQIAFNDIDFCLRVRKLGYLIVFTPYAELYHHESKSRGYEDTPEKIKRFNSEIDYFGKRWGLWMDDPYYNPNLSKLSPNFEIR